MTPNFNTAAPAGRNSPWVRTIKFLIIVVLVIILFLLGQSMVRHRFFRGGRVNRPDTVRP